MTGKRSFLLYVLVFLSLEKFVQHMFVTYAFLVDLDNIRSEVVGNYKILMVVGFLGGAIFLVNLYFLWRGRRLSLTILFFWALMDFIGEFVAQGRLDIVITLSFVVATIILLILLAKWKYLNEILGIPIHDSPQEKVVVRQDGSFLVKTL